MGWLSLNPKMSVANTGIGNTRAYIYTFGILVIIIVIMGCILFYTSKLPSDDGVMDEYKKYANGGCVTVIALAIIKCFIDVQCYKGNINWCNKSSAIAHANAHNFNQLHKMGNYNPSE
jgi:DMSO reductase anchor subunit